MSGQVGAVMGSSEEISTEAKALIDEFLRIMSEDSDSEEMLKKAFHVLSEGQINAPVSADLLCRFMRNCGVELTIEEVEETIRQLKLSTKDEGQINYQEFIKIIKVVRKPTVVDQLTKIYEALDRTNATTFVLYGESGVGKTWMARKIADRAIRQREFDIALWIYLTRIYQVSSLQESIAYQLSIILPSDEELEMKENKKQEKLEVMINAALKGKRVLLILDDEGSKMKIHLSPEKNELLLISNNEGSKMEENNPDGINLYRVLVLDQLKSFKFLVTRKNRPTSGEFGMMVMPWTHDDAKSFVKDDQTKDLADFFVGKSRKLPAEVLIIAKTLRYFGQSEARLQKLRNDIEKLEKDKKDHGFKDLLISGYERIPKSVLIDCYSSETPAGHFLNRGAMVNYNELICYWIMEGHLGHFDRIEDAYVEGHRVLMELLDCGLLKNQESGYVASSGAKFDFDIRECFKFFRSIHLGLATTFDSKLGRIALADGMIRTVISSGQEKKKKMLTLLLDGNYIGEISDGLFVTDGELENLAIFNPTRKYFPLPVFKMHELRLLVLRGCEFLENSEQIFRFLDPTKMSDPSPSQSPSLVSTPNILLEKLTVFELSGPSFLKTIPDDLFKNMPNLKNINLSFLQMESLPESFYHLTKLEILILRGCSSLQELGTLKNFKELLVLDISGSTSVSNILDKSFSKNKKLRIINLSHSRIERLPLIHSLENLKSLSLSGCAHLLRIRKSGWLKRLQILDISGAMKVEEFLDPTLERLESLEVLNISRTSVRKLPSNIGNPRYLYLKDCLQLKKLPPIEGLSKVEVLDLSGSCYLEEIRNEFFQNIKCLRELNLSKTSIKCLSFISKLVTVRKLLLSQCLSLEKLENLTSLEELEVLDLSCCNNLTEIEDKSFDKMHRLHSLDLSGLIQLHRLPSLSKLTKLKKLFVKGCPKLSNLPGLENLPSLEILDHSGTILKPSPSFHPDCHPVVLGPISLNIDPQKLLKDLGASNIYEVISSDMSDQEGLNQCNWRISNWQGEENGHAEHVNGVHFLQLIKIYPSLLRKNFSRFCFLVYPTEARAEFPDKFCYTHEIGLRDAYLSQVITTRQNVERCLEIRGFNNFPQCLQHLLQESEFVVLIDNPFFGFLHDFGIDGIKNMKSCWIERCNEMEHVIGCDIGENLSNLEILWISDVMKMKSLFSMDIQNISFKSLKSLYLEYCPQLTMLCSSCLQLESLEILYIKYCQKLGTLFTDDSARLEKLTALHLWGLPEFKKISCKLQSLSTLRVGECPLLENIFTSTPEDQENEFEGHEKLEILHVKFCDKLRTIFETQHKDVSAYLPRLQELEMWGLPELEKIACRTPNLKSLKIAECPLLESAIDSDGVSERLKILEVKSCDKLKTIIHVGEITENSTLGVERMELLCLPELQSIGVKLPFLKEENCIIWGCPKLEKPELAGQL